MMPRSLFIFCFYCISCFNFHGSSLAPSDTLVHGVCFLRPSSTSGASQRMWRWKESVLGDGQDFFVPKPLTTHRLASVIVREGSERSCGIEEAVVLGNCARLMVLVTTIRPQCSKEVANSVAVTLLGQVSSWQDRGGEGGNEAMLSAFDRPEVVSLVAPNEASDGILQSAARRLMREERSMIWSGAQEVTRECCLVAVGLSSGGRGIRSQFDPFSSRDAHVQLQLKRSFEACRDRVPLPVDREAGLLFCHTSTTPPCRAKLGLVLRAALRTGKLARDPSSTTAINTLKKKQRLVFFGQPSEADRRAAAEAVLEDVVAPAVEKCCGDMSVLEGEMGGVETLPRGQRVASLRERAHATAQRICYAESMAQSPIRLDRVMLPDNDATDNDAMASYRDDALRRLVNQHLHDPTIRLRLGMLVDEEELMATIEKATLDFVAQRFSSALSPSTEEGDIEPLAVGE